MSLLWENNLWIQTNIPQIWSYSYFSCSKVTCVKLPFKVYTSQKQKKNIKQQQPNLDYA